MSKFRKINLLKGAIVLVWLVMAFALLGRTQFVPEITIEEGEELEDYETFMSVYFKDQKIGYTEQSIDRGDDGYFYAQGAFLRLNLMGEIQELRTYTTAQLNKDMSLKSFEYFMSVGPVNYQLSGTMKGLVLELKGITGGNTSSERIVMEEVPRLASGLMPYMVKVGFEKGRRFKVSVFDPSTLSNRPIIAVVEDTEKMKFEGREITVFRIRSDYMDTRTFTWVDSTGRPVKEQGLLGMTMVRTTEEEAKKDITGRADVADVIASTSAPSSRVIKKPREVRFLKAKLKGVDLTGFELDGGRQKLVGDVVEVSREKIDVRDQIELPVKDPELRSYLKATHFVQSRDRRIVAQARKLTGGVTKPLDATDKVIDWVFKSLEKRPTMSIPSAVDVLENKVGDCNEHSVLAAALLRASGVPTRIAVGVLYYRGRFYYHAWLEVYWGQWMAIDPLLGQIPADATHIRFLTGGLAKQSEMVRVIGRLEVEVLEIR